MASLVTDPFLRDWLARRNAFGGQFNPPTPDPSAVPVHSGASNPASIANQVALAPKPLLFDYPETFDDDYDNPYSKPGPATLADGAKRFFDSIGGTGLFNQGGQPNYSTLQGPGFKNNPISTFMDKYSDQNADRPRSGGLSGLGEVMRLLTGAVVPGALPFNLLAGLFTQAGAHHDFNPSRDSNLFYETDRGRMTWDSLDPGGGGQQSGTLNAYNMLMAIAENDENREIQTERGWIKAGDLANYIKNQNTDEGTGIMPTDIEFNKNPTNFAQMPSLYTGMTNEDAVLSLETRYGEAWNDIAEKIISEGGGYNDAVNAAAEAAQELRELGDIAGDYKGVTDLYFHNDQVGRSPTPFTLDRAVKQEVEKQPLNVHKTLPNRTPPKTPPLSSVFVDTTSSDPVDDAWDTYAEDFGEDYGWF